MEDFTKLKQTTMKMLSQLGEKPDLTPQEIKNASDAACLLEKLTKVEKDTMEMQMMDSSSYSGYGANSWVASGPYPDYNYGDNYGRQMRSSRTGRYMNGPNSGQTIYGHSIKDRMVAQLEDMMDQAHNDYERQEIQNEIKQLRMNNQM